MADLDGDKLNCVRCSHPLDWHNVINGHCCPPGWKWCDCHGFQRTQPPASDDRGGDRG